MIGTYRPCRSGFAGAFVDREVETKGVGHASYVISNRSDLVSPYDKQLNYIDSERAKNQGGY